MSLSFLLFLANSNCHLDASEKYSEIVGGSSIGRGSILDLGSMASVDDCAEECNKHSRCNTFEFWLQSTPYKKKGSCVLRKGGSIKGWSHEWGWKRISGACFPKGNLKTPFRIYSRMVSSILLISLRIIIYKPYFYLIHLVIS